MGAAVSLAEDRDAFLVNYWARALAYDKTKLAAYESKNVNTPVPLVSAVVTDDAIHGAWRNKLNSKYQDLLKYDATMDARAQAKFMALQVETHSRARAMRSLNREAYYTRAAEEVKDDIAFMENRKAALSTWELDKTGAYYP